MRITLTNPRWGTADNLKINKSPYLRNRFSDHNETSHDDAKANSESNQQLKF